MSYKLLLIAPDGDYVTESEDSTIDEACEASEDMGSCWIFYPFHFVIKDHGSVNLNQRVIVPPDNMPYLKGKSIKTVLNYIPKSSFLFD